ncbi:glycosyltransferase family 4 protein [Agrobacterium tumefaciens]|nr:glycosyltransferase family 4 protein [Agrobacterium tumefaciens]NTE18926.1 glycosyltransferase family 4 protein [Agrobacterium tumefaciens]
MLVDGYVNLGHEVSLFAHQDSVTAAKLFAYKGKTSTKRSDVLRNSFLINKELFSHHYDVIHSFGRLIYILPQLPFGVPKIMSYQREPTLSQVIKAKKIAKSGSLTFTGCSAYISNQIAPFAPAYPIFNGVDLKVYDFNSNISDDAPLIFLGRIEPIKGTHIAIQVAQATNRQLVIAGNIPPEYTYYFEEEIKPHLSENITYVGPINDEQKNTLLGNGLVLLMPIEWNEPFGIVMAEAMACGTPIIAFNKGSVPEVVFNGINGFRCDTLEEMIQAVQEIASINRKKVREDVERRFSSEVIIQEYLNLYKKLSHNEDFYR